jgi:tRNA threonylcarbamoyladenosine biosynthesis protein TsaB
MFNVESTWLLLDGSGLNPRAGLWNKGRWLAYRESPSPALETLYGGVRDLLTEAQLTWTELGGYLYVDGPGSVLGLRLTAMAVRTWQTDDAERPTGSRPVFACGSLPLAAALAQAAKVPVPYAIFTESRQGRWHVLRVDGRVPPESSREVGENELPTGTLFHLPARKAWSKPPSHAQGLPATLQEYPEILGQPGLFHSTATAVPYAMHGPEYKKWEGGKAG